MKKQIVAPSKQQQGSITLVTTENGVLLAACNCGAPDKKNDYDFTEMLRRENLKRKLANKPAVIMSRRSCDCGGTLLKANLSSEELYIREDRRSHHTKPRLRKHNRETVRGIVTI